MANDSAGPAESTQTLAIVAVGTPLHGTAALNNNGTPADPTDDTVIYTPAAGFLGTDTFSIYQHEHR